MAKRIKNGEIENTKKKTTKKKVGYSKLEFTFNVVSLIVAICVGFYFGARSFYYYSKQSQKLAGDALTLNGSITSNNYVVTTGDGLHQDTDGYYFKGNVYNNYVKFANRLFRVVRINNDGSVKLVSENIATEFMWGDESEYVGSNLDKWLDKTETLGTGVYLDTLPSPKDFLVKTEFNVPSFNGKSATDGKKKLSNYVTTLTIKDYSNANGTNSYLNIKKYFWLIGTGENGDNLYVSEDGELLEASPYEAYGVRPVITLKPDTILAGGIGTLDDPFVINQGDKVNLVHSDIVIDGCNFKVFYDNGDIVKMAFTNFLVAGGIPYGKYNTMFDPTEKGSLAHYLNNDFYNAISFKEYLEDSYFYVGEVSPDTSLDFTNLYYNFVVSKVGMLNTFDYQVFDADGYYLNNHTSDVGTMAYVYHNNGLLEEVEISEARPTVPVITIKKSKIDLSKGQNNTYILR